MLALWGSGLLNVTVLVYFCSHFIHCLQRLREKDAQWSEGCGSSGHSCDCCQGGGYLTLLAALVQGGRPWRLITALPRSHQLKGNLLSGIHFSVTGLFSFQSCFKQMKRSNQRVKTSSLLLGVLVLTTRHFLCVKTKICLIRYSSSCMRAHSINVLCDSWGNCSTDWYLLWELFWAHSLTIKARELIQTWVGSTLLV